MASRTPLSKSGSRAASRVSRPALMPQPTSPPTAAGIAGISVRRVGMTDPMVAPMRMDREHGQAPGARVVPIFLLTPAPVWSAMEPAGEGGKAGRA